VVLEAATLRLGATRYLGRRRRLWRLAVRFSDDTQTDRRLDIPDRQHLSRRRRFAATPVSVPFRLLPAGTGDDWLQPWNRSASSKLFWLRARQLLGRTFLADPRCVCRTGASVKFVPSHRAGNEWAVQPNLDHHLAHLMEPELCYVCALPQRQSETATKLDRRLCSTRPHEALTAIYELTEW